MLLLGWKGSREKYEGQHAYGSAELEDLRTEGIRQCNFAPNGSFVMCITLNWADVTSMTRKLSKNAPCQKTIAAWESLFLAEQACADQDRQT